MALTDKFEVTLEGKKISFLGFDLKGAPKPHTMQIKTEEEAEKFVKAIRAEVEAMKKE
jgi:hypothetical protein